MKIKCIHEHLSIKKFETIDLPDLTVLIGVNGSGKSHLLQAIEKQAVITDLLGDIDAPVNLPAGSIVRIENGGEHPAGLTTPARGALLANNTQSTMPTYMAQGAYGQITPEAFETYRRRVLDPFEQEILAKYGEIANDIVQSGDVWKLDPEAFAKLISERSGKDDGDAIVSLYEKANIAIVDQSDRASSNGHLPRRWNPQPPFMIAAAIQDVAEALDKAPLKVEFKELLERKKWGDFSIFNPEINKIFCIYRETRNRNLIARDDAEQGGSAPYLSESEFTETYGRPPWRQISDLMPSFGLPYKVRVPDSFPENEIIFELEDINNGSIVNFSALSSGERVIMRFVLSLFKFDPLRVNLSVPKLLLLDEMDASLHPEMVYRWLSAIREELVDKRNIKCILTTHSPTTVALAPEAALFEMVKGQDGPSKITKQQALNRLTYGLPALSVNFDGRRQVFTESDTDAYAFENILSILKSDLNLPRTLTFISTGIRKEAGEINTGCQVVKSLVNKLAENGNKSVFGIIDWDRSNRSDERVKVIGEETHYSFDNIILNPLLIGCLIIRNSGSISGLDIDINDLPHLSQLQAQNIADAIQNKITFPQASESGMSFVQFHGDLKIQIMNAYLKTNGHKIEEELPKTFPQLWCFNPRSRGSLAKYVIERVIKDWKYLTPMEIITVFKTISEHEFS
ncbi:AAA family ATPase [Methylobacterium isbiliense]|uniref:ATPase AAA-type core domain-containing protein n=1 Tax=Methylobacterium isbiliense TaxID=315478 RepID=A0ABQ4SP72_9HYPH|nr:ATP-binding protein [Methylobacterium isbiliense]MDN3627157.1 AAA family ATPase [Methylobacterium isbiliense]GJE03588.1 hypothetical protein GMJLKIPL_5545 [Methylobacterium isbiliense]